MKNNKTFKTAVAAVGFSLAALLTAQAGEFSQDFSSYFDGCEAGQLSELIENLQTISKTDTSNIKPDIEKPQTDAVDKNCLRNGDRMEFIPAVGKSVVMIAAGGDSGWEVAKKTRNLTIYTRKRAGSDIREVKAVGAVDASPSVVWKVIGDYEHYTEFMPYVKDCRIVKKEGERIFYVYELLDLPIVSDRDFTIKITWEPEPEGGSGVYRASWVSANNQGPAEKGGVVRVQTNEGAWNLEPLDGGKRTLLTYYLYTDPGASIPRWLANKGNTKALPGMFKRIRNRVKPL